MPRVTFVEVGGSAREIDVAPGTTILQAAKANDLPMLGTCGGSMICATCHVKIDEADRARLAPPSWEEEATLELAIGVGADSRLGCQIRLGDEAEGIRICLTSTMATA